MKQLFSAEAFEPSSCYPFSHVSRKSCRTPFFGEGFYCPGWIAGEFSGSGLFSGLGVACGEPGGIISGMISFLRGTLRF